MLINVSIFQQNINQNITLRLISPLPPPAAAQDSETGFDRYPHLRFRHLLGCGGALELTFLAKAVKAVDGEEGGRVKGDEELEGGREAAGWVFLDNTTVGWRAMHTEGSVVFSDQHTNF